MPDSTVPFDAGAEAALRLAETEAQRLAMAYVGTEHVLLGVASDVDGVGAHVLREFGIDFERIRNALQLIASARPIGGGWRATARIIPSAQASPSESSTSTARDKPTWSLRANKAIGLARDDARRLNHSHIGTGHLLLGLIREGDNMATGILASHGVQRRVPAEAHSAVPPAEWGQESRRLSVAYLDAIRNRVLAVFAQSSP